MTDHTGPAIHETIGETLADLGGFLRCESCGTTAPLGDPGQRLLTGWPKCCGYTMRWWTRRQIDAGEVPQEPGTEFGGPK